MNVDQLAESLRSDPMFMQNVVRWYVLPARPAVYEPFPDSLDPRLLPVLEKRGVHQLYRHQAHAIREVLAGRRRPPAKRCAITCRCCLPFCRTMMHGHCTSFRQKRCLLIRSASCMS